MLSCLFAFFVVIFERFCSIVVRCGRRGIRSTYVQECVPTCIGIARFVVVSERFCAFGRMAWGAQKSPHEPFFGIVRFVVVSDPFSVRFCVLQWFRTDLSDADVMRMQDLGARIPFSSWLRSNVALLARPREGLRKSFAMETRPSLPL